MLTPQVDMQVDHAPVLEGGKLAKQRVIRGPTRDAISCRQHHLRTFSEDPSDASTCNDARGGDLAICAKSINQSLLEWLRPVRCRCSVLAPFSQRSERPGPKHVQPTFRTVPESRLRHLSPLSAVCVTVLTHHSEWSFLRGPLSQLGFG